jgi:hypothetical protein
VIGTDRWRSEPPCVRQGVPHGQTESEGRQYQKSSIKKDSGDEDWTELDWTRSIKNFWPSNSNEREMREATMWKRR